MKYIKSDKPLDNLQKLNSQSYLGSLKTRHKGINANVEGYNYNEESFRQFFIMKGKTVDLYLPCYDVLSRHSRHWARLDFTPQS